MKLRRIAKTSVLAATAAMAISVITATGASAAPQSGVPNGYKLTFSDEFDGNSLDTSKWGYQYGCFDPAQRSQVNYTDSPENVSVNDGYLSLTARYSPTKTKWDGSQIPRTCNDGSTVYDAPFTSGMITTKTKDGTVLYAAPGTGFYAEARIKLPSARSSWAAFWGTGTKGGWPGNGEIDIFEAKGYDPSFLMSNVHTPRIGNPKKTTQHQGMMHGDTATSQSEWHTYGLLKTADAIEFFFDGQMTHRVKMSDIKGDNPFLDHNNNLVLKLNHMVGGSYLAKHDNWSDKTYVDAAKFADDYKGGADGTDFSGSTMYVDYVRVYEPSTEADQHEPTPAPTHEQPAPSPEPTQPAPEQPAPTPAPEPETPAQPAEPTPAPTPEQPTPSQPENPVTPGNDDNATPSQPEQPATPAEPSNPGSNDNSNQEPPATKPDDSKPEPPATTKPDSDAAKPSTPAKPTPDKPSQPGNNGKPSTPAPSQPTTPAPAPSTPSTGNAQNGGDTSNSNGSTTTPAKPGNNQGSTDKQGSRGNSGKPSRLANTGSSPWFRPIVFVWNSFWGWLTSWRFW